MLGNHRVIATLPAKDIGRAKAWYREKLGLTPVMELDEMAMAAYASGDSQLLLYESQFAGTNQATAATWLVDDIDAVVAELRGRGVEFENYQDVGGVTTEEGIARGPEGGGAAWFKDSEGNIINVTQVAPGMTASDSGVVSAG